MTCWARADGGRRRPALGARSADEVRGATAPVVPFSPAMAAADRAIKQFLLPRMYRHERVMRIMRDAEGVVADLFGRYCGNCAELPEEWRQGTVGAAAPACARHIADFIAGMTDRYALIEHARLFDSTPEL